MSAVPFSFSLFPDVEELIREELEAIYEKGENLDSVTIQVAFSVDTISQKLSPEVKTRFPASQRKFPLIPRDLIREDGTFKIEEPKQTEIFGGKK